MTPRGFAKPSTTYNPFIYFIFRHKLLPFHRLALVKRRKQKTKSPKVLTALVLEVGPVKPALVSLAISLRHRVQFWADVFAFLFRYAVTNVVI